MVENNPTLSVTNPKFPSGAANSTLDSGAVNGMEAEHITIDDVMPEKAAPKNPPATWSAGS